MTSKEKILKYLGKYRSAPGKDLSRFLGISRQGINKHLKDLIQSGEVIKEGVTKGALYRLADKPTSEKAVKKFQKEYTLRNLEEDRVFQEISLFLNLEHELGSYAMQSARYSFTEMLNNAIDHSNSAKCSVETHIDPYNFEFRVRDFGIGIFHSIFEKFHLQDENAAVGELIKGKTTTMAERHTGEGIFFTSKAADQLSLRSHKVNLIFDNMRDDVFVEEARYLKGSDVYFRIGKRSRRRLDKIFHKYAPKEFDYQFDRTRVHVKLFQKEYISRSEARRLIHGLDKFSEVTLDFTGVKSIGQGFADEVFRVFQATHPHIVLRSENVSAVLEPMIKHVVDKKIS